MISKQHGECRNVHYIDRHAHLVFYEGESGLMTVLTNNKFSKIKSVMSTLDFTQLKEFREPVLWKAHYEPQEKFSMIIGVSTSEVKTISIASEHDIQPKRIKIHDHLWVWYSIFENCELNKPIKINAYDENGKLI
ncbi:hypothetical protein J7E71_24875 [Mesobacillus foraminis]|uniref:hypothetical protein n=1 Tax=Mesobacillus foraminis TaxID=279826 RepID=UPI001BEB6C73|nr:hypothetical protein [Mesobacillus foraminis]MBT2759110.1 hypothetical protein [Mesobacillus foraminis]